MGFGELDFIPLIVAVAAGFTAAFIDTRTFRIPNLLTAPLFLTGIIYNAITFSMAGNGVWSGIGFSFGGACVGAAVVIGLFLIGGMGAGDVKLMAAVGAWVGARNVFIIFIVAGLSTGVYSLIVLASEGAIHRAFSAVKVVIKQLTTLGKHLGATDRVEIVILQDDRQRRLVPFGAMVAFGISAVVVWRVFWGQLVQ